MAGYVNVRQGLTHIQLIPLSYKATLSNPNTSEAAKEHARQQLQALDLYKTDNERDEHNNRVLGGK